MPRGYAGRYSLRGPCSNCPFRADVQFYGLAAKRIEEIADSLLEGVDFTCHKTNHPADDGETMVADENSRMCGGAMATLEREDRPTQGMRISERLGLYDRNLIDPDAPVHDSVDDWRESMVNAAQEGGW